MDYSRETREEFEARYPRPKGKTRVLIRCSCQEIEGTHWAWGFYFDDLPNGGLARWEKLAEQK